MQGKYYPNNHSLLAQVVASPSVLEVEAIAVASSLAAPQAELMTDWQSQLYASQGDAERRPSGDPVMYKYSRTGDDDRR